jgi:uncharacterized membrane protein YfcA
LDLLFIAIAVTVASFAGTVAGFGESTLLIPLVSFSLPLPQTLLLVGTIHWFGDIWQLLLFRKGINWRLIALFGIPGIALSIAGARLTFLVQPQALTRVLGVLLVTYVLVLAAKPDLNLSSSARTAVAGGALSGFASGFFGVGGPVRGAFLQAYDLDKVVYLATLGAVGLAVDSARLPTYVAGGTRLSPHLAWGLLLYVPLSLAGAIMAQRVVKRLPQQKFRAVVAIALLALGMKLLLFP